MLSINHVKPRDLIDYKILISEEVLNISVLDKNNEIHNINIDNVDYKIPTFLILRKFDNISKEELSEGLNFCRSLMENKFFIPNNIKFPYSRRLLENKFTVVN